MLSDFDGQFFWPAVRAMVSNAGIEPISDGEPLDAVWRKISAAMAVLGNPISPGMGPGDIIRAVSEQAKGDTPVQPAWYDDPVWDRWQFVADILNGRGFVATGPIVDGKFPKRAATEAEILAITAPAGRSYLPASGLPYRRDTAENAPRFDWSRAKRQLVVEPLPRFNRLSSPLSEPITIQMLEWPYVVSMVGTGWIEFVGDTLPGGRWEIHGVGADTKVWDIMPHDQSGQITITPHGDVRFATADTHGTTGHDPDYPTIYIHNEVFPATAHQAAEVVTAVPDIVAALALQGTILVQGQHYASASVGGARDIIGWNGTNSLRIDAGGNVVSNVGWASTVSAPLGVGGSGDPFRVALSFRERNEPGGFNPEGFTRVAGNGGPAGEDIGRYKGGLGEHMNFWFGRDGVTSNDKLGAAGYDLIAFTSEIFENEELSELTAYPEFTAGENPIRVEYGAEVPLQVVASRGEINNARGNAVSAGTQKMTGRTRHYIGEQDVSQLQIGYAGFYVEEAAGADQNALEVDLSAYTLRLAVEINGVTVRATFGGQPEGAVPAGSPVTFCDPILPSAFGLDAFPAGLEFWLRFEKQTVVGGRHGYHFAALNDPIVEGERYFFGSLTAPSRIDGTGDMGDLTGWTGFGGAQLPMAIIGVPVAPVRGVGVVGASIEYGAGETGRGDGSLSGGYVRRALWADHVAYIGLMKPGESARSFVLNSAKRRQLFQYCTHVICGHGGNDYSYGYSLANTQTRWSQIWQWAKEAGAQVYQISLSPKTNGTWTTVEGQTPRAGFEVGGAWKDAAEAWFAAQVVDNPSLDGYLDLNPSQEDATVPNVWRVDLGTPTSDGTHPATVIHIAMADRLRTLIGEVS